jgi:hypothetical protein
MDEMLREPNPDESYHAEIALLGNRDRLAFGIRREVSQSEPLRIDPTESGCSGDLINLLADLEIHRWIETANVDLGLPAGTHIELTRIAHVSDLSLLANKTQELALERKSCNP